MGRSSKSKQNNTSKSSRLERLKKEYEEARTAYRKSGTGVAFERMMEKGQQVLDHLQRERDKLKHDDESLRLEQERFEEMINKDAIEPIAKPRTKLVIPRRNNNNNNTDIIPVEPPKNDFVTEAELDIDVRVLELYPDGFFMWSRRDVHQLAELPVLATGKWGVLRMDNADTEQPSEWSGLLVGLFGYTGAANGILVVCPPGEAVDFDDEMADRLEQSVHQYIEKVQDHIKRAKADGEEYRRAHEQERTY